MVIQLGHTHLLTFHVQTKKSHPGSIEDGIFLSRSDGERLPDCWSGENLAQLPLLLLFPSLVTLFTASLASFQVLSGQG